MILVLSRRLCEMTDKVPVLMPVRSIKHIALQEYTQYLWGDNNDI